MGSSVEIGSCRLRSQNYSFASDKRRRPDLLHGLSLPTPGGGRKFIVIKARHVSKQLGK